MRSVCQSALAADPVAGGRTGRPRDPAVNALILEAAQTLLEEVGCAGFTMEAVALRAGIGKQTLYRRWASRGDLLIDLYYLDDDRDEPAQERPEATLSERLGAFLDLNMQRLYEPWRLSLLRSLAATAQSDPSLRSVLLSRITWPRMTMGRTLLRRAVEAGQARPDLDFDVALAMMFGAIWFNLLFSDEPIAPELRERILREMVMLVGKSPESPTGKELRPWDR